MEIYIEYAFIENFLFDGVLLYLSLKAVKVPVHKGKLAFSACLGAVFSLLFPLLYLSKLVAYLLKFSVGFLLCLVAFPPIKTKKDKKRWAFTCIAFFSFSFFFGGVLLAFFQELFPEKTPSLLVLTGFLCLTLISLAFIKRLYKKRAISRFLYDCRITYNEKNVDVEGFLDSGNLASKNDLPVCFISPDIYYELFEMNFWEEGEQVRDEIQIQTINGVKNYPIFKGHILVFFGEEKVERKAYFAPSKNMLSRGYKVILSSYLLEGIGYKEKGL